MVYAEAWISVQSEGELIIDHNIIIKSKNVTSQYVQSGPLVQQTYRN